MNIEKWEISEECEKEDYEHYLKYRHKCGDDCHNL